MSEDTGPPDRDWHAEDVEDVAEALDADPEEGLGGREAERRLEEHGRNELERGEGTPWYQVLARQFADPLVLILVAAAALSAGIGNWTDAAVIAAILVLNAVMGFVQEWRAQRAIEALEAMLEREATVVRDGEAQRVDAADVVPGDLVSIEAGDSVPADLRLVRCNELRTDESALTGESTPVRKGADPVDADAELAERASMAFMGTAVTHGRARGLVVATGMDTRFGRIAGLTETIDTSPTPLQKKLARLARWIGGLAVGVSALTVTGGWLAGRDAVEMVVTGISLAVAVVPEGLPAVVTITMALGIRRMVQRDVLLRRLETAETLGATTVICADKTGTLTENEMTADRIHVAGRMVEVSGSGLEPEGGFETDGGTLNPEEDGPLRELLETALVCNNARIESDDGGWRLEGDPTEGALVVAAMKAGLDREGVEELEEFPFTSERKRMTVVAAGEDGPVAHVKGAPEVLLDRCSRVRTREGAEELKDSGREELEEVYDCLAESGRRVLAIARRKLDEDGDGDLDADDVERDLTLLGIVGMMDPPRGEVAEAIERAGTAGIQVVVITGDAPATARQVAEGIGLDIERVITGSELKGMDKDELADALEHRPLFARTEAEQKTRIVEVLQDRGEVIGMTGDGVNDAPALKKADIGIAMGRRGTDVARGASDMVLRDDNFVSIINGVEEGRRQFDNIRKFVRYLLSSNTAEVLAIAVGIALGWPLVLLPLQILWMNLVTDGPTALALGLEKAEAGIMRQPPRDPDEPILGRLHAAVVGGLGAYMAGATLFLFWMFKDQDLDLARTMAFTGLVVLEKVNVLNFRTLKAPLHTIGFFSNPWLLVAIAGTTLLQLSVVYVPVLQGLFHTTPLGWAHWGWIALVALPVFLVVETVKLVLHRRT